jgi:magnesium chelatase subunit D
MTLSFAEIVGMDVAKQALLLLAVNPALAGVAIAAPVGSGKSTLARAFAALLPAGTPFVELPVGATEDSVLGGLDLEATLAAGRRVIARGLLARAHGGVLYADGLNLLDERAIAHLISALSDGVVRVERDGLSEVHPARFLLVGTYDPVEGEVRRGLLDRIGLIVPLLPQTGERERAEVVRRNLTAPPNGDAEDETTMLRAMIADAREHLPTVHIAEEQMQALVQTALSLGVEGNRADVFAVQAALAKAALDGREAVDDDDLKLAVRLVLLPRATRMPAQEAPEQRERETTPHAQGDQPGDPNTPNPAQATLEELLLEAAAVDLPAGLLDLTFAGKQRSHGSSRGAALSSRRGRFVRAVAGDPCGQRIALLPTLIAASPWQKMRRAERNVGARLDIRREDIRVKRFRDKAGTLYIFVVDASGSMAINRMREAKGAVVRLLQDAYVHRDQVGLIAFRGQQAQVLLEPSQSVERAKRALDVLPTGGGTPLASALLAAWRMAQQARARGIAQVTLVLMTDGRGNVPLRAAPAAPPSRAEIQAELQQIATCIRAEGIQAVVIDTQVNYLSQGEAARLASWLGGRYVYLPNAKAAQIAMTVAPR